MAGLAQLSTKTILIAETQPFLRSILVDILRNIGISKIHTASSCPEAITQVRAWMPDAIILDWHLKDGSGAELANWVRKSPDSPNQEVPIVIVTGDTSQEKILHARDCGIDEIIVKPVVPKAVISRVKMLFAAKREFVSSQNFIGPDRRRKKLSAYKGRKRRLKDTTSNLTMEMESEIFALCREIELQLPMLDTQNRDSVMRLYLVSQNLWNKTIEVKNCCLEAAARSMFNYIQGTGISGNLKTSVISHHLQTIANLQLKAQNRESDPAIVIKKINQMTSQNAKNNRVA